MDMMDNASALPTCPQRQQKQQQQICSKSAENHPHDFTMKDANLKPGQKVFIPA